MDKPELVKSGIYRKVIRRSSSNNDLKGTLKALEIKLDELREIRPAGKFLNEQDIQPTIRKSMLARAAQEEINIISSTPHHTRKPNEQHFFNSHLSVILSPISAGRQSNVAPKGLINDNSPKDIKGARRNSSDSSSSDTLAKIKQNISQEKHNSSVIYVDTVNDGNQEEIKILRKGKKEQSTNRSRIGNKVNANSKKTVYNEINSNLHKSSHETEANKSPQKVLSQSPARLATKLSRIPLRAASQDADKDTRNSPSEIKNISRSKSETSRTAKTSTKTDEIKSARQVLSSTDNNNSIRNLRPRKNSTFELSHGDNLNNLNKTPTDNNSIRNLRTRKNSTFELSHRDNLNNLIKTPRKSRSKNTSKRKEEEEEVYPDPALNKSKTKQSLKNTSVRRDTLTSPAKMYATRSFSKQHSTESVENQNPLITEPQPHILVSPVSKDAKNTLKQQSKSIERINNLNPSKEDDHGQKNLQISAEINEQPIDNPVGKDDKTDKTLTQINANKDDFSAELSSDSFDHDRTDFVNKTPRRQNCDTISSISQKANENNDIPIIITDVAGTKTDLINKSRPSAVRCKPADKHDDVGDVITRSIALSPFIVPNKHQETRLEKSTGVQLAGEESPSFSNQCIIEKSPVEKLTESIPKLISSGKHTDNNNVVDVEAQNNSTDNLSCLINEISAKKRARDVLECQIRRTTNRGIQTSLNINPVSIMDNSLEARPLSPVSLKAVERMTQTSNRMSKKRADSHSRSSHSSSSKLSEVNSSSGAASDILAAGYRSLVKRYSQTRHNIFESLDEGDELGDWDDDIEFDDPDLIDSSNRIKPNYPWRYVNEGLVPEKMKSFSLSFIPRENERRSCRSNNVCSYSDGSSGLSSSDSYKTRNSNSRSRPKKSLVRRDTMLSRSRRRQYTKRNQKTVEEQTSKGRETQSRNELLTNEISAATNRNENESLEVRGTSITENQIQIANKRSLPVRKSVTPPRKTLDGTYVSKASTFSKKPAISVERSTESSLSAADKRLLGVEVLEQQPVLIEKSKRASKNLSNTKETKQTKNNRNRNSNLQQYEPTDKDIDHSLNNDVEKVAETNNNNKSTQPNPPLSAHNINSRNLKENKSNKAAVKSKRGRSEVDQTNIIDAGEGRPKRSRKPVRFLTDIVVEDESKVVQKKRQTSGPSMTNKKTKKIKIGSVPNEKPKSIKGKGKQKSARENASLEQVQNQDQNHEDIQDQNCEEMLEQVQIDKTVSSQVTQDGGTNIENKSMPPPRGRYTSNSVTRKGTRINLFGDSSETISDKNNITKNCTRTRSSNVKKTKLSVTEQIENNQGTVANNVHDTQDSNMNGENNSMPPPKGSWTLNSVDKIGSARHLISPDSGFETVNNTENTKNKTRYTRSRTSRRRRTKNSLIKQTASDGVRITDNACETVSEFSAIPEPTDCIENTYSSERASLVEGSSSNGLRVFDGISIARGLEQSLPRSEDDRGLNSDASSRTSRLNDNDYIKYMVDGKLYSLRYVSRKPENTDYKHFGNLEVTQTVKYPDNRFSAGHIRLGPGEQKRLTVTTKYAFIYNVLSGLARVQVHNRETSLQPGDFITVPVGVEYSIQNIESTADLIIAYAKILA